MFESYFPGEFATDFAILNSGEVTQLLFEIMLELMFVLSLLNIYV